MRKEMIPELAVMIWDEEEGNVCIQSGTDKLVLNKTASIVWECLDGINTIEDIINIIYDEYKDTDTIENVEKVVEESLEMFEANNLIIIRETMDFDGWLIYE